LKLILKKIVEYIPLNPPSKGDFVFGFLNGSKKPPPPLEGRAGGGMYFTRDIPLNPPSKGDFVFFDEFSLPSKTAPSLRREGRGGMFFNFPSHLFTKTTTFAEQKRPMVEKFLKVAFF
jgi:hypothetical protein